jgi:hypothetical protein
VQVFLGEKNLGKFTHRKKLKRKIKQKILKKRKLKLRKRTKKRIKTRIKINQMLKVVQDGLKEVNEQLGISKSSIKTKPRRKNIKKS